MSTRVLPDNGADGVRPFAWRTVALTGETVDRRRMAAEVKPAADASHPFEARILELEQLMDTRTREARQAGFSEGEVAGRARAEDEVRSTLERLAASITEIDQYRGQVLRQTEIDAVRLAIAIARRVLRRELTVDPAAIEGLVRAALERLQSQETCKVRMHPDYVPALRVSIDKFGMSGKVEVIADAAQEPGAAVFEMPRGNLDASVDSQLREIERGLVDRFQRP
jgi:flagellar assembly protein FliH